MTILRMDNVGVVVEDLEAATAFFVELGMELEGEMAVEGRWVDRVVGLDGVHVDIAMVRPPDGHSRLELTKFHTPTAISAEPNAPANSLGIRRIMFAVDDIEDVLTRLGAHGAELIGEVAQYDDSYLLCYVRGPKASSSRWPNNSAEPSEPGHDNQDIGDLDDSTSRPCVGTTSLRVLDIDNGRDHVPRMTP
jgi:catechol 2,3-dioxygenase-like lactoylglutathione lyase family enzyme